MCFSITVITGKLKLPLKKKIDKPTPKPYSNICVHSVLQSLLVKKQPTNLITIKQQTAEPCIGLLSYNLFSNGNISQVNLRLIPLLSEHT